MTELKSFKLKAAVRRRTKRGVYVVEWGPNKVDHAVFADMKRARAFCDGFNTALQEKDKYRCALCGVFMAPDEIDGKWDGYTYKWVCECMPNPDMRMCVGSKTTQ